MLKNLNKHSLSISFLLTLFIIVLVDLLLIPNPNVVLITVIVYLTFLYGYSAGILSGSMVIAYSLYFFSKNHSFINFEKENLKKTIVIVIFIPILVWIVGSLKKKYDIKTIELEKEKEKYKELSVTDWLTGLNNRQYLNDIYKVEVQHAINRKEPLSLLLIDIDFFKQYNDWYGHVEGDNCIKRVADAISNIIRQSPDYLARYGGEEFVVLCPNTEIKLAQIKAQQILQEIILLNIPHKQSKVSECVTVSIGVATGNISINLENFILLDKADQALYFAKNHGRNQYAVYKEDNHLE